MNGRDAGKASTPGTPLRFFRWRYSSAGVEIHRYGGHLRLSGRGTWELDTGHTQENDSNPKQTDCAS
jgi:hypothetical protein